MGIKNCIGQGGGGGLSLWYGYQELHRTGLGGGGVIVLVVWVSRTA